MHDKVVKVIKITAAEAEAFRARVREQNERIANMIVIDVDEFIALFDDAEEAAFERGTHAGRQSAEQSNGDYRFYQP